jgi:hypothetical protein
MLKFDGVRKDRARCETVHDVTETYKALEHRTMVVLSLNDWCRPNTMRKKLGMFRIVGG